MQHDEDIKVLLESFGNFCDIVDESKHLDLGEHEKLKDVLKRASLQMTEVAYFVRDYCKDESFCKSRLDIQAYN